jgi:hypothetical protein
MIDISGLPVVDAHCHPFVDEGALTSERFTDLVSLCGVSEDTLAAEVQSHRRNSIYVRWLVRQVAEILNCEPALERVVEVRNEAARDYRGYVSRLYQACGLTGLVVDFGWPEPPIDKAKFSKDMPVTVVPIYRIEPLIDQLLKEGIAWSEFRRRYDEAIGQAMQSDGYHGLKSTIAYYSGLDVSPTSRTPDQGLLALDAIRLRRGGAMKKLLDHLLCRALELSMELDVPMQVHAGIGDFEINPTHCNPMLLYDLLKFPVYRSARVVLVHCYPFMAEAGYMASMLPRVYCDLSEGVPWAAHAADRIYLTILEMAPFSKVMYGSDGLGLPEVSFLGAKLGRSALAWALDHLVQRGFLDSQEAENAAALILAGNARALYRID